MKKPKKKKVFVPPPDAIENKYKKILNALLNKTNLLVNEYLTPKLPQILDSGTQYYPEHLDDFLDDLDGIMGFIRQQLQGAIDATKKAMQSIQFDVIAYNTKQFEKVAEKSLGVDVFLYQPWLKTQIETFAAQNVKLIQSLPDYTLDQIKEDVLLAVQGGQRFTAVEENIKKRFGISSRRAKLIARDQVSKLNSSLNMLRQTELGVTLYTWQTSGDERVRKTHKPLDGKLCRWDNPNVFFDTKKRRWVSRDSIGGVKLHPGQDYQCFTGDSNFFSFDSVNKIFRRFYIGNITKIFTDDGLCLKATTNHPILTNRGWIAINDIQLGDYIISASDETFEGAKMNINKSVSTFNNCFNTLMEFFGFSSVNGNRGNFHGDISNKKIDIISLDCILPDMWNISLFKQFGELIFSFSDSNFEEPILFQKSNLFSMFNCLFSSSKSFISCMCNFFSLINSELRHSNDICLRRISDNYAIFNEPLIYRSSSDLISFRELFNAKSLPIQEKQLINRQIYEIMRNSSKAIGLGVDSPSSEFLSKQVSTNIEFEGNFTQTQSFFIKRHCVINKNVSEFIGHVFNLETKNGYYGILDNNHKLIAHNCRCVSIPDFSNLEG